MLLADGRLGLLDFGSVGRIDQGLRSALQRLLLALDRGDPSGLADALLTQLAPGFDIVAEARRFAGQQFARQFRPDTLRATAADELVALLPLLRRLPRRIDRIGGALEAGRLSVNVRLLADEGDRRIVTDLL